MKLITTHKKLNSEFLRLMNDYNEYHWATAWAGIDSEVFDLLVKNTSRIKKMVVGIHFYQTHPDFIEAFLNHKEVKFFHQPDGTFHPKMYLFYNDDENWEMIIGSPNFTRGAFGHNTESSLLVSSKDFGASNVLKDTIKFIDKQWHQAKYFEAGELMGYYKTWENQQSAIKSLSGTFSSRSRKPKPIHLAKVITRTWEEYVEKVKQDATHGLEKRFELIDFAQDCFKKKSHFKDLSVWECKTIAGLPTDSKYKPENAQDIEWGYFGSMKGRGDFHHEIIEQNIHLSNALDEIPLNSQITHQHYKRFIKEFEKVFTGNYVGTASRLLSMKRPDVFICFDSKNRSELCKDFEIVQSGMDYDRYWKDIIERIFRSEWWLNPKPKNETERRISDARVAFLDSIYYEEK
jgi:hypothetical protein